MWLPEEILHGERTNPKYFWTERMMKLYVNTQPEKHRWNETDTDAGPVLDNIAAAAHACNISKNNWVHQCFEAPSDAVRFLAFLEKYKRHINSYWFYALLSIIEADEEDASSASAIAQKLKVQATQTGQFDITPAMPQRHLKESSRPNPHALEVGQYSTGEASARITPSNESIKKTPPSEASFAWIKDWLD